MDPVILEEKLEALRYCVRRIEQSRVSSVAALAASADRQDILSLNITRAVQLCVDIAVHVLAESEQPAAQTMGEAFDQLAAEGVITEQLRDKMRAAVGFRNIAVHNYQAIDWNVVHAITHEGVEDLRAFAASMAKLLPDP